VFAEAAIHRWMRHRLARDAMELLDFPADLRVA